MKNCHNDNLKEEDLHKIFITAWNKAVRQQDKLSKRWDEIDRTGTELQKFRVKQMRGIVAEGEIKEFIPELVMAVLDCILVKGGSTLEVRFLDGTKYEINY